MLSLLLASAICHAGLVPDPACTPGDVLPVTIEQVCKPGYATATRVVTSSLKAKVYKEYGIGKHRAGQYQIDHRVSIELGGSNDLKNLWPQPAGKNGYQAKDKLEASLHAAVCHWPPRMTLEQAQRTILDWPSSHKR